MCGRIRRKKPNIGAIVREVAQAGGKSDGSRATPCDMVYARMKGDKDAIGVGIIISRNFPCIDCQCAVL
jgi:hypothetical protein